MKKPQQFRPDDRATYRGQEVVVVRIEDMDDVGRVVIVQHAYGKYREVMIVKETKLQPLQSLATV